MRVVFSAGRFNGPTKEHHKLIQKVLEEKGDRTFIYVFGPRNVSDTSFRNPFTISEKIETLSKLYPNHAGIFFAAGDKLRESPVQCLSYIWHELHVKETIMELTIVAGEGMSGIRTSSQQGGSIDSYKSIIERLNKKPFEGSNMIRMWYENVKYIANERGNVSSRMMREYAARNSPDDILHVKRFREMLHPAFTMIEAADLMRKIKDRGYNGLPKAD